jgi:hypothetical protein
MMPERQEPEAPIAIKPAYTCKVDEPISLHKGRIKLSSKNDVLVGIGSLQYLIR